MDKELTAVEQAQAILQQEKEERAHKCMEELKETLKANNCDLTIIYSVNDQNQIMSNIQLVAL
jgi:ABC-type uncharacterized transport system substrate-binding protein